MAKKHHLHDVPPPSHPPRITQAQQGVLRCIENLGAKPLLQSLQFVHRTSLYNSTIHFHDLEKQDLFHVQELMDALEELIHTCSLQVVLRCIENWGAKDMLLSLQFLHRTTLYNSTIHFHDLEKQDLFHVQELMDALEELAKEDNGEI